MEDNTVCDACMGPCTAGHAPCDTCGYWVHGGPTCSDCLDNPDAPPPGSWAEVARAMSKEFPDFDWDSWKDEMKEQEG